MKLICYDTYSYANSETQLICFSYTFQFKQWLTAIGYAHKRSANLLQHTTYTIGYLRRRVQMQFFHDNVDIP